MKLKAIRTKSFCLPYELPIKRHALIKIGHESQEELQMRRAWTKEEYAPL